MKTKNYETIVCEKLKALREIKELKQTDIATILGIDQSTYSLYENGQRRIKINDLCKIADEFDLPFDWFTGRDVSINKRLKDS